LAFPFPIAFCLFLSGVTPQKRTYWGSFLYRRCSSCHPTNGVKALKETASIDPQTKKISNGTTPFLSYSETPKGSDTLESFLSKVAFESDFRKKSCTCVMKTFAFFLLLKETFTIRTCSILASFFRKLLLKATIKRKLSSVSLSLGKRALLSLCSLSDAAILSLSTYQLTIIIVNRISHVSSHKTSPLQEM